MKLFVSLLLISCGATDESPGAQQAEQAARVRALVRQLGDDDATRRQGAEEALLDMGAGILDQLPPDTARMSPESKQRLARVRGRLQVAQARLPHAFF